MQFLARLTAPTGGALARIERTTDNLCLYIFWDAPRNQLVLFISVGTPSQRLQLSINEYGRYMEPPPAQYTDTIPPYEPFVIYPGYRDTIEVCDQPVDVTVSSCGRSFDPLKDRIYVLDQANHRVVKLR